MRGATTQQMLDAPHGAIYVWVNSNVDYPKNLARNIGRDDLKIVPRAWLTSNNWIGRKLTGIVVDHAVWIPSLSPTEFRNLQEIDRRISQSAGLLLAAGEG